MSPLPTSGMDDPPRAASPRGTKHTLEPLSHSQGGRGDEYNGVQGIRYEQERARSTGGHRSPLAGKLYLKVGGSPPVSPQGPRKSSGMANSAAGVVPGSPLSPPGTFNRSSALSPPAKKAYTVKKLPPLEKSACGRIVSQYQSDDPTASAVEEQLRIHRGEKPGKLPPLGGGDAGDATMVDAQHSHRSARPGTPNKGVDVSADKARPGDGVGTAYISLMYALKQYPSSMEFVYLRRAYIDRTSYNPYALEVVPFHMLDPNDFYTMSSRGITHYVDGGNADFTSLEQYEREYELFHAMTQLKVFRKFRSWKGFSLWRRAVRRTKLARARTQLEKNLFSLNPIFQVSMGRVRQLCFGLSCVRLHQLVTGLMYSLRDFLAAQHEQQDNVSQQLASFAADTLAAVKSACLSALDQLEQRLNDFYNKGDEGADLIGGGTGTLAGSGGGVGRATARPSILAAAVKKANDEDNYAFTIAAASRSEQRKLLCYVKMCDYMICDTLHGLLVRSAADLLAATAQAKVLEEHLAKAKASGWRPESTWKMGGSAPAGEAKEQAKGGDDNMEVDGGKGAAAVGASPADASKHGAGDQSHRSGAETDRSKGAGGSSPGVSSNGVKPAVNPYTEVDIAPLFVVEVLFEGGSLQFSPSEGEFQDALNHVLRGFIDTLSTVTRLLHQQELMHHVSEAGLVDMESAASLAELIEDDKYEELVDEVKGSLTAAFHTAEEFKAVYAPYCKMVMENEVVDFDAMKADYEAGRRTLADFRTDMQKFLDQERDIREIAEESRVGILKIDSRQLKQTFLPSPQRCLAALHALLPRLAHEMFSAFMEEIHDATAKLTATLDSVEDFVAQMDFVAEVQARQKALEERLVEITHLHEIMEEFEVPLPDLQHAAYQTLNPDFNAFKAALEDAETQREDNVMRFSGDLDRQAEEIAREGKVIRNDAQHEMILDEMSEVDMVLEYLTKLAERVRQQQAAAKSVIKYQRMFAVLESKYEELDETAAEVELKLSMWQALVDWEGLTAAWVGQTLRSIDTAAMEEKVARYHKLCYKLERGLPPNKVVPQLSRMVTEFKETLPVIQALRNPALKPRHWDKIEGIIGEPGISGEGVTLGKLLELKVMQFKDALQNVSTEATQETTLEELLQKVAHKWQDIDLVIMPYKDYKDTFILGGIEDVIAALEDSMVTMTTITSSRYVAGIRHEVEKMEKQLKTFSETLDEWLACQKAWMYLESIFSAPDIQRQLPAEAKAFFTVDKQLKEIMWRTRDRSNALQAGTTPGWHEIFVKANETLDRIQKNLEDYLETKRMAFPRFYFLSNDELLEILAQTRNVQAVQPHMSKCFDGMKSLDFGDDPKSIDILAMVSPEGERVSLGKNLKARGNVEAWLTAVEQSMVASLRRLAKKAFQEYPTKARREWVLHQPAQLVLMISQVYWVRDLVEMLTSAEPTRGLQRYLSVCIAQLSDLSALVRGQLSSLQRKILAALITIDVHARDIVDNLIKDKVTSPNDFGWQMQLRYSWEEATDEACVQQVSARFLYAYEYLGAQSRLVVTPMTDRCYMTLTGALHLKLGGAPAGPAGTGKTETTKDLGKALGVNCVVFNCGDNLDSKFMGKFFSGLAQCGAWACFDEFNRIDIEVLSVVAQQLLTIQNALKAQVTKFNFEGREIKLVPTCGVFITMNPGYAGRTELPDNLKALFRPMSMMVPDYALVAEVMLFSEGFENAKTLSSKMVKLYKLSSEQLSQQDHYDFGMRALKSVLVMAGSLKRSNPTLNEDIVLIRAMKDSNLPKFLSEDAVLFEAIVTDLFPDAEIPTQDYGELDKSIRRCIATAQLQIVPKFVTKIIQLYETLNVRFGVMLVGPTGGGKTTCYRMLQAAMTDLRAQGSANDNFQATRTYVLNPKCIKMGELYGEYSELTNEWTDGLASTIIRECVADTELDRKWVVFDGPVDAIWIENMNTVLDDNRTLCLPNGERIKLNGLTMRMLFEVEDLAVASPATVSRCGMVYVPPEEVGWRPFVKTWATTGLPAECGAGLRHHLVSLFEEYVDGTLAFMRRNCREEIASVDINLIISLCRLLESMLQPQNGVPYDEVPAPVAPAGSASEGGAEGDAPVAASDKPATVLSELGISVVNKLFVFCLVWSIGGNLVSDTWDVFDDFVRELVQALLPLPSYGLLYDFFVNIKDDKFERWEEVVPPFHYKKDMEFFQMLVPTVDTVRYSYLLEQALVVNRSVLLNGVTGVGKSVIVTNALAGFGEKRGIVSLMLNFSAQTSSIGTQMQIESKLEKKRRTRLGAPVGKRMAIFIDDINMPARETYGAQPPIELLRQFQDFRGFYDRKKLFWKEIEDVTLVAACAPPGGGRNIVTARFFRHFNMLCLPPASENAMRTIFSSILRGFMLGFPGELMTIVKAIVESSLQMYVRICEELLPTPTKSHYTFNLRDVSKVFQGILMVHPGDCGTRESFVRLWVHESARVFHDRLVNAEDKTYFMEMTCELIRRHFEMSVDVKELFVDQNIIFADFLKMGASGEDRVYEESKDPAKLVKILEDYLDEYNLNNTNQMDLVFFLDAVNHTSRIARILRQKRGNAMLVGVGGSGKQSLTRFASFMAEFKCFQIELKRGYGTAEFREDLRNLYKAAGIGGRPTVFLFTDTQIVDEAFVEDINNVLNSGEVPGLLDDDEKERICAEMRPVCQQLGIPESRDNLYGTFIARVRDNLHMVLCMSPVGNAFRQRCRQFPSLINCCTIDWFDRWPESALLSVSTRFLRAVELPDEAVRASLARMCVEIHVSVTAVAEQFYAELRRHFYTTPKSYLDLISLYVHLLNEKRSEMRNARDRLLNGLSKLAETNTVVAEMKTSLSELQPKLQEKQAATTVLLAKVDKDKVAAQKVKVAVATEEAMVRKQAAETQAIAEDAKADLDEAMPALEAAVDALGALNKGDITEIKSFAKPPPLVQKTMEAVCTLLNEKTDWDTAKKILSDTQFIKRLMDYDKDHIPEKVIKALKKLIEDPTYTPDQVGKQSNAARSLCMWTHAMDVYARVSKVVEPKRLKLAEAEATLNEANARLMEKQSQLQQVEEEVAALEAALEQAQNESQSLAAQNEQTTKRLARAGKLTSGLADEQVRWKATADEIQQAAALLVGDVFLSAACVSYYGAFTGPYRDRLVESWVQQCKTMNIPVSEHVSLRATLTNPVEVREWAIWGLPSDAVSVDSGVLVTRGRRWPLMIDPQGQANKWIKAMENKNGLRIIKLTDTNFLRTLENSIRLGNPVLLEDIGETLDPALEPILLKQVFTQGGRQLIRIGETDVDYDPGFKFYITTKLSNPHYLPEVCIKVTIINFTVTRKGLEDQLLGDVVRRERPDLEEQKDRLVVSISNDKKQLKELEDKILKLLKESEGNILDDEMLINTLNNSKLTSGVIQGRVKEAEQTETEINAAREQYRVVATRGSILYFVVADLALIGPMYQYSLSYFTKLFNLCIEVSPKSPELPKRLAILIEYITEYIYTNVCRGVFEEHKSMFSFLMCASILRASGEIAAAEWNFVLRGLVAAPHEEQAAAGGGGGQGNAGGSHAAHANPAEKWITATMWASLVHLNNTFPMFKGLVVDFTVNTDHWKAFFDTAEPHVAPLPGEWGTVVTDFGRLMLLRVLRPEKLVFGFSTFVGKKLGVVFTESPPFSLDDIFRDTNNSTPIIFVLSTGADPTSMLQRFGEKMGLTAGNKLHMISLGQGQGPVAEVLITRAAKNGDWVCLQNCHLASSWMHSLETIVEGFSLPTRAADLHPDFRLWLTSMPTPTFPVLVLQNGIKITNEPPKGLRANMLRLFRDQTEEFFESCSKPATFKKLLFALAFFHAVVQERRKFGALGWNILYDFNNGDVECSMLTLKMMLDEQPEVPWPALEYVVGEINYGGRVTDDNDRMCLRAILRKYYVPDVLKDSFKLSASGTYYVPPEGPLPSYIDYLQTLPTTEAPEVFGMHENANITFQAQETRKILDTILSVQPRIDTGGGGGKSSDEMILEMADDILKSLPKKFRREDAHNDGAMFRPSATGELNSLAIVLSQEMERFNRLIATLSNTLQQLQKAIKGLVVMSGELELMYGSMLNNAVPALWEAKAYPSLKPLGAWIKDFGCRIKFMTEWLTMGEPACFWMPGLFFPQGFLTGVLQTFARRYKIAINKLNFTFKITDYPDAIAVAEPPTDGVYVNGLFVDGARWNDKGRHLDDAHPGEMIARLPVVHFVPREDVVPPKHEYQSPLYKTAARAGVLSTTGASTNFIIHVSCPIRSGTTPDFWTLQGTALLCATND
eukprot:jgi/Mesvir1/16695/Mv15092-RA.1